MITPILFLKSYKNLMKLSFHIYVDVMRPVLTL